MTELTKTAYVCDCCGIHETRDHDDYPGEWIKNKIVPDNDNHERYNRDYCGVCWTAICDFINIRRDQHTKEV